MAEEIKELQGELGDLNTFLDQLHTNAELRDINNLCEKLKSINEQNAFTADEIFRQRKQLSTSYSFCFNFSFLLSFSLIRSSSFKRKFGNQRSILFSMYIYDSAA